MTPLHKNLEELGLTPNQAVVYLTLVREGGSKAGQIAKQLGFHRNLVYVALQELTKKQLISGSKVRGLHTYKALSPSRLLLSLHEKEQVAKNVIEELSTISKQKNKQEIIMYEGIDEFRRHAIRTYRLAKQGVLIRYLGVSPQWHSVIGPILEKELHQAQIEKKIRMQAITKTMFSDLKNYLLKTKKLSEARTNPLVSNDTNNVEIQDDRISIQSFVEPYLVIEIVNKELAQNYKNYFDFLWTNSKRTK